MKKKDQNYVFIFLVMVVVFIAIVRYPNAIGLNPTVGTTGVQLFPSLLLTCISIYMLSRSHQQGKFAGTMILGIALCLFIDKANTIGIITNPMLLGLTVIQAQIWIVALSAIFGAVLFSYR